MRLTQQVVYPQLMVVNIKLAYTRIYTAHIKANEIRKKNCLAFIDVSDTKINRRV
jgi:hypothetical protein